MIQQDKGSSIGEKTMHIAGKMLKKMRVSSIYKTDIHKTNCTDKKTEKTLAIFLYMWYLYGAVA